MTRAAIILFLCMSAGLTASCGSGGSSGPPVGGGSGGATPAASGGAPAPASGGSPAVSTGGAPVVGGQGGSGPVAGNTLCGDVALTASRMVAAGETLTVCAGATISASSTVSITVAGTLTVQGTTAQPVRFQGAQAGAGSWAGLVLLAGGTLTASNLEIHGAAAAVDARAGSSYAIDHILVDNAVQGLNLASNGTVSHGTLHGLASEFAPLILVNGASPHVSDVLVDHGTDGSVDLIVVNGATSAPVFDHIEVTRAHCAFHINVAAGVTVSNSYIHNNAYAFMMYNSVGNLFMHNNFQGNQINVGACFPTTTAQVSGNFFEGPATDSSCATLEVTSNAAAAFTGDVGVRP